MKPEAFFDFAESIFQSNTSPAACRSVTSRAYYAALHKAVEFLQAMDVHLPKDANAHARVPDILDHSDDNDLIELATVLRNLRLQRNEADYDLDRKDVETAEAAGPRLADARKVIDRLSTYLLGKDRPGTRFENARSRVKTRADFLARGLGQ